MAEVFFNPADPVIPIPNRARRSSVRIPASGARAGRPCSGVTAGVRGCSLGHARCSSRTQQVLPPSFPPGRRSRISRGPRGAGGAAHAPGGRAARGREAGPGRPCGRGRRQRRAQTPEGKRHRRRPPPAPTHTPCCGKGEAISPSPPPPRSRRCTVLPGTRWRRALCPGRKASGG